MSPAASIINIVRERSINKQHSYLYFADIAEASSSNIPRILKQSTAESILLTDV